MAERLSLDQTEEVARQSLRRNFPLFEESHTVKSSDLDTYGLKTWLGYRTVDGGAEKIINTTHFDVNFFWPNICYLTYIEVEPEKRGKGNGAALYATVEDMARKLGCTHLTQTPSGIIVVNNKFIETRESYLLRKGYKRGYAGQVEKLL